jgi:DNA helicase-4
MKNERYLNQINTYFIEYLKPYKDDNEFESHGEYIQFIKDQNIRCFRTKEKNINGRITLQREYCKSTEEVMIANYLFLNNIIYEYERPYEIKTSDSKYSQYKPDFYLPEYHIYIEHFAIDRNGNAPRWFSAGEGLSPSEKYNRDMEFKQLTHKVFKTTLVETYSYEKKEGILLQNLQSKLRAKGVVFVPKSANEIWKIINEMAEDEVSNFTHLIITFLNLLKSNNYSINEVAEKNRKLFQGQEQKRNEIFLELFTPIYIKYNEHLKSIPTIDFSDMINHATEYISSEIVNLKYRYIIVDEYQDISISRYKLLKSIRDKNPGSKVYCVGDDWQSIFRFSGSDISLFTEFEKYFGVTEKSYIETTYRFNSRLINISSAFILKNPNQIRKKLISYNNEDFVPYEIHYTESNDNDDTTPVIESLNSIQNELNDQNKTCKILALGRYGYDIDFLKKDISNFTVVWNQSIESYKIQYNLYKNLEIEFLTVHRAKGLEADYVLLLNCNSGKYGFPSEQADDPILNLILTRADQFPNGEERRLFYVAMTRCSRKVFMITKAKYKSKFIIELENDNSVLLERKCPFCKTGRLIETSGTSYEGLPWRNLTCSNWNWGCDYLEWIN